MDKVIVIPAEENDLPDVEKYFSRLSHHPTEWARSLKPEQHGKLDRLEFEKGMDGGWGFIARDSQGICGVSLLEPCPWETEYFGISMGRVSAFRTESEPAAEELALKIKEKIRQCGFSHIHAMLNTRDVEASLALQGMGWKVVWGSMRMACDISKVDASVFSFQEGDLEVVEYEPHHFDTLMDISRRLEDYSWLAFEKALPESRRREYKNILAENCCKTNFADVSLTLLRRGVPIGLNSSKIFTHPPAAGGVRYTKERITFVDPRMQMKGGGGFFERAVVKRLSGDVDYITGNVRLGAAGMFRILEGARFKSVYSEYCLSIRL